MAGEINFRLDQIKRVLSDKTLAQTGFTFFVQTTPRRSGNAQNSTDLLGNTIVADYKYAQRLDQGYSRQAPKGMTGPTLKHVQQYIKRQEKK
jgi:hypothetical protein